MALRSKLCRDSCASFSSSPTRSPSLHRRFSWRPVIWLIREHLSVWYPTQKPKVLVIFLQGTTAMTGAARIRIDGTPRSYRDRKDFAMEAARSSKAKIRTAWSRSKTCKAETLSQLRSGLREAMALKLRATGLGSVPPKTPLVSVHNTITRNVCCGRPPPKRRDRQGPAGLHGLYRSVGHRTCVHERPGASHLPVAITGASCHANSPNACKGPGGMLKPSP
jgi:hypothetical protein